MIKKVEKGKYAGKWKVRIQQVDKVTGKRLSFPVKYADSNMNQQMNKLWVIQPPMNTIQIQCFGSVDIKGINDQNPCASSSTI